MSKRPIAVAGLGRSGLAAVEFLLGQGHPVLACDQKASGQAIATLQAMQGAITLVADALPADELAQCESILLSPGIPRQHPALAKALEAGVQVINDIEWLYRSTRDASPLYIGITGTNGKSTVTTMVGKMVEESGIPSRTGGNLGQAALSLWAPEVKIYVLELSSFQLESIDTFQAGVGTIINLTPDHMDRYATTEDYLAAKVRLLDKMQGQGKPVLMVDDPLLDQLWRERFPHAIPVSLQRVVAGGVYLQDGILMDHLGEQPQGILPADQVKAAGWHNKINAAIAAATALAAGIERQHVAQVLATFPGLTHRMEPVRTLDGVVWYNDSKGTNVGAVLQSLQSFDKGVILIGGGRDKHSDFTPLAPLVRQRCSRVILMGEAANDMAAALKETVPIERVNSMVEAVQTAHALAKPGDVVLLSPACASFDMFANFEDRGHQFRQAVEALPEAQG
ncbi:MAG: UDP-N-acetylmuramoyl-L-alanine--D-glutamate ligase [Magnetococcales bacterium]|nr:UDP-N-acetylmuramoyl-L-alanine--D-glutamate ligase [Magnetococcales bacterium]